MEIKLLLVVLNFLSSVNFIECNCSNITQNFCDCNDTNEEFTRISCSRATLEFDVFIKKNREDRSKNNIEVQCDNRRIDILGRIPNITLDKAGTFLWNCTNLPLNKSLAYFITSKMEAVQLNLQQGNLEGLKSHHLIGFEQARKFQIYDSLYVGCNGERLNISINYNSDVFDALKNVKEFLIRTRTTFNLKPGMFKSLRKVELLELENSHIPRLDKKMFDGLSSANVVEITNAVIDVIATEAFSLMTNLKRLKIIKSSITLEGNIFGNNKELEEIAWQAYRCRSLKHLPNGLLSKLPQLLRVDLSFNGIESLPENLFDGSDSLEILELVANNIKKFPIQLLVNKTALLKLDLSINQLTAIESSTFIWTKSLRNLQLAKNSIEFLDRSMLVGLENLQILNLHSNQISFIADDAFTHLYSIGAFDYTENKIQSLKAFTNLITQDIALNKKLVIDLASNDITTFSLNDWRPKKINLTLVLNDNRIEAFDVDSFYVEPQSSLIIEWKGMSSIMCDCRNYNFIKFLQESKIENIKYGDESSDCYDFNGNKKTLKDGRSIEIAATKVSEVDVQTITCDYVDSCPNNCTCIKRPRNTTLDIDCSSVGLEYLHIPQAISNLSIKLNLRSNEIKKLSLKDFENLLELYASGNQIESVEFRGLENLKVIELHNNSLRSFDGDNLKILKESKTLITLAGNRWNCDCSMKDFWNFSMNSSDRILDFVNLTCNDGRPFTELTEMILCPGPELLTIYVAITFAVVGMFLAIYYKYRRTIILWFYVRNCCTWLISEDDLEKKYDAFVVYSSEDDGFVADHLVPRLEDIEGYKLCLHERDWLGGPLITTQIANSIENSRRIIIVMSANFLKSEWCNYEFRAAYNDAVIKKKSRLMVISLEEIDIESVQDISVVKDYIKLHTYIKWDAPHFWIKNGICKKLSEAYGGSLSSDKVFYLYL